MNQLEAKNEKHNLGLIMVIYLAGIFIGGIDTGIVTPARTIIQNCFGVDAQTGIWMITIYTLSYAASVPIMGKLADRHGRKYIYIICISFFAIGSLFCGLSEQFGGFTLLIISRVIQAIGAGGILPLATAEFGTSFPMEKRGMALGLVGGAYGIANVFGASVGSAILDIVGIDNWKYIFFINLPISLFIIIAGFIALPKEKTTDNISRIDLCGIMTLTTMTLSILYGLKNLDFFDFSSSIITTGVYPFLLLFIVLIPLFIFIEKKAKDPVMNLRYFTNKNILITMIISTISGFVMMGVVFVPQFSENCLKLATGSGGYLVIILGLFSGIGAPITGKLIDKFGAKIILYFGFACSMAGSLFMIFVTTSYPNTFTVIFSLILSGLGMGITMGTPVNYMMLANTDSKESNSSLATLSLVRSIGTAIAPAIMVGFIANAGISVQGNIMDVLPTEIDVPPLAYSEEITSQIADLKNDSSMRDKLQDVEIPDLSKMEKVSIDMISSSDLEIPDDVLELLQSSDVTTITANTKTMAKTMFKQIEPRITSKISSGINQGIGGIDQSISGLENAKDKISKGCIGIGTGISEMKKALSKMETAKKNLDKVMGMLSNMPMPAPGGMAQSFTSIADMIPDYIKGQIPEDALKELQKIKSVKKLQEKINQLDSSITTMKSEIKKNEKSQEKMKTAITTMSSSLSEMKVLSQHMSAMEDSIPGTLDKALDNYLEEIDNRSDEIETTFQSTLNDGFKNAYATTVVASFIAIFILLFYSKRRENK